MRFKDVLKYILLSLLVVFIMLLQGCNLASNDILLIIGSDQFETIAEQIDNIYFETGIDKQIIKSKILDAYAKNVVYDLPKSGEFHKIWFDSVENLSYFSWQNNFLSSNLKSVVLTESDLILDFLKEYDMNIDTLIILLHGKPDFLTVTDRLDNLSKSNRLFSHDILSFDKEYGYDMKEKMKSVSNILFLSCEIAGEPSNSSSNIAQNFANLFDKPVFASKSVVTNQVFGNLYHILDIPVALSMDVNTIGAYSIIYPSN